MNWLKRKITIYAIKKIIDSIDGIIRRHGMKSTLKRFGRTLVSIIIAGTAAQYGDSGWYLSLSPVISATGKYLRNKYKWGWLPF